MFDNKVIVLTSANEVEQLIYDTSIKLIKDGYSRFEYLEEDGHYIIFKKYNQNSIEEIDYLVLSRNIDFFANENFIDITAVFDDNSSYTIDITNVDYHTQQAMADLQTALSNPERYYSFMVSNEFLINIYEEKLTDYFERCIKLLS